MNSADIVQTVIGLAIAGLVAWCARELLAHGRALAILINEISPEHGRSLREIVNDHDAQLAVLNDHVLGSQNIYPVRRIPR